ncbi:hypothetical protein [Thalassospira lohafexi]|uniref:hypothetical protein n=1 Tax=Thalassospira lohafexi TaxID=744227 RepID=UPI001054F8F3|nr:hypothetical protein [Thalassospira lohafexi]
MLDQGNGQQDLETNPEDNAEYIDFNEPCDWLDQFTTDDAKRALTVVLWTCIGFGFGVVFGFVDPMGFMM